MKIISSFTRLALGCLAILLSACNQTVSIPATNPSPPATATAPLATTTTSATAISATSSPTATPVSDSLPGKFDPWVKKLDDYVPYTLADIPLDQLRAQGFTILAEQGITVTMVDSTNRLARLPFPESIPSLRDARQELALDQILATRLPGFVIYHLAEEEIKATLEAAQSLTDPLHFMPVKIPMPEGAEWVVSAISAQPTAGVMPGVPLAVALSAEGEVLGVAPAVFLEGSQPQLVSSPDGVTELVQNGVAIGIGPGQNGWQMLPPPVSAQRLAALPQGSWDYHQSDPENGGVWTVVERGTGKTLLVFDSHYKAWLDAVDTSAAGVKAFDLSDPPQLAGLAETGFPALYRFPANVQTQWGEMDSTSGRQETGRFTPTYYYQTPVEGDGARPETGASSETWFLDESGAVVAKWLPENVGADGVRPPTGPASDALPGRMMVLTDARGDLQIWSEMRTPHPASFAAGFSGPDGIRVPRPVAVRLQGVNEYSQFLSELRPESRKTILPTLTETEQILRNPAERLVAGFLHLAAIQQYAADHNRPLNSADLADPALLEEVASLQADHSAGKPVFFDGKPVKGFVLRLYDPSNPLTGGPVYLDQDGYLTINFSVARTKEAWENAEVAPSLNESLAGEVSQYHLQIQQRDEFNQYLGGYPLYGLLMGVKLSPLALLGALLP